MIKINQPFAWKQKQAKLLIQENIRKGVYELVWSYMNEYENNENPYSDKSEAIRVWENIAAHICLPDNNVLKNGKQIQQISIKPKDALNLACAIKSGCRYYITTDKALLRKAELFSEITIINPIDFIRNEEESDGSNN